MKISVTRDDIINTEKRIFPYVNKTIVEAMFFNYAAN